MSGTVAIVIVPFIIEFLTFIRPFGPVALVLHSQRDVS